MVLKSFDYKRMYIIKCNTCTCMITNDMYLWNPWYKYVSDNCMIYLFKTCSSDDVLDRCYWQFYESSHNFGVEVKIDV